MGHFFLKTAEFAERSFFRVLSKSCAIQCVDLIGEETVFLPVRN